MFPSTHAVLVGARRRLCPHWKPVLEAGSWQDLHGEMDPCWSGFAGWTCGHTGIPPVPEGLHPVEGPHARVRLSLGKREGWGKSVQDLFLFVVDLL